MTEITSQHLELINRYATREFKPEEIYTFRVTLCDNDIDRDFERFTKEALDKLAELFVGKTGIYDHDPKGKNQWARIYKTEVLTENDRVTGDGQSYSYLQAHAYMVRTAANEDLITEIEAGIKKEVSIGCKMGRMTCSICGCDRNKEPCTHQAGKSYQNKLCFILLDDPLDAYEFSFVAVPAQKNAGITKSFLDTAENNFSGSTIEKLLGVKLETTLSKTELTYLQKEFGKLKVYSQLGKKYIDITKQRLLKTAATCGFPMEQGELKEMSDRLTIEQLEEMCRAIEKFSTEKQFKRQLAVHSNDHEKCENGMFKV